MKTKLEIDNLVKRIINHNAKVEAVASANRQIASSISSSLENLNYDGVNCQLQQQLEEIVRLSNIVISEQEEFSERVNSKKELTYLLDSVIDDLYNEAEGKLNEYSCGLGS
jgi:hypothetical protein